MLGQLGQAGKGDRGNVVPLENRQGVNREGARKRMDSLFLAPVLARGSLLSDPKSITPNVPARANLSRSQSIY